MAGGIFFIAREAYDILIPRRDEGHPEIGAAKDAFFVGVGFTVCCLAASSVLGAALSQRFGFSIKIQRLLVRYADERLNRAQQGDGANPPPGSR